MESKTLIEKSDAAAHLAGNIAKGSAAGGGASAATVWLTEHADAIASIAGIVSIVGVIVGLCLNAYFNHRKLELERKYYEQNR